MDDSKDLQSAQAQQMIHQLRTDFIGHARRVANAAQAQGYCADVIDNMVMNAAIFTCADIIILRHLDDSDAVIDRLAHAIRGTIAETLKGTRQ